MISLEDIPLHSTNLLSLLDEEGIIHYQSPSIERLCEFEQDELVGVSCTACFHPDDREAVYDAFKNVVSKDEFVRVHGWEITITESEDGGARFERDTDGPKRGREPNTDIL